MASISPAAQKSAPPAGESFAALFEESLSRKEMRIGEVITAEVVSVDDNFVVVNAGLKSESIIPVEEFRNDRGEVEVKPGDFVSVAIEALEDGYGATRLSRDKAKRLAAWHELEKRAREGREGRGHDQRQGEGRPHRHGERHPRLPARLARRHAAGEGHHAVRRQADASSRSSSSTASATTWSCRAARCSKRPRAPSASSCSRRCRKARS